MHSDLLVTYALWIVIIVTNELLLVTYKLILRGYDSFICLAIWAQSMQ